MSRHTRLDLASQCYLDWHLFEHRRKWDSMEIRV